MESGENKRKHLELIQEVITRMSGNLFYLKGWAITLVGGLFALSAKEWRIEYIFVAFFLVMIFWVLDGYFLRQERLFRSLYNDVRAREEKDIDFSMNTKSYEDNPRNSFGDSVFSITILWFYFSLVVAMLFTVAMIGGKLN